MTIEQVAEGIGCSASKISRIETSQSGVTIRDVREMAGLYRMSSQEIEILVDMAVQASRKGWWHLYGPLLTSAYIGLEAAADAIEGYESQAVPGLLQTEDYARTMISAGRPGIPTEEIEARVGVRFKRQSLLIQDDPVDFRVVLDEAVLHRPVGGRAVMRRQLERLVREAERPNVTLQVLPFAIGEHPGMDGTFAILRYRDSADQDLVFASHAAGGLFLEKDEELQRYAFIFDQLRSRALGPDESVVMIAGRAREV